MVDTDMLFTLVVCKVSLPCVIFDVKFTLFWLHLPPKKTLFSLIKIVAISRRCAWCLPRQSYCSVWAWGVVGVPSLLEWVEILLPVCSWRRGHQAQLLWQKRQQSVKLHMVWRMLRLIWWILWGPPSIPWKNGHMLSYVWLLPRGRMRLSECWLSCRMCGILKSCRDVSPSNPWAVLLLTWCFVLLLLVPWQLCCGPWEQWGQPLGCNK